MLLVQAQEARVALNEEQLVFLANTREGVDSGIDVHVLTTIVIFQSYDIDALDSDCDEAPAAQAAFMTNLSSYDSNVLFETLILVEESRLKMKEKQAGPLVKEKKVDITHIDYTTLNKLSEHFVTHFVPEKQLSAEQAFWLPISKTVSEQPSVQP
uniref:Uncharacterized protein n=1 Tax=Tanacetum cinerariifolium TaxID=118510 RepID=A0A6L2K581_TANCI|nr:hypothetical protein [Tanacetum cinerariifolium]GEW97904.1 hypothetical protein [Tanacetum cinerariifolium]